MKLKSFLLILLFGSFSCFGQNFDLVKMDKLFKAIEDNNRGMGSLSIFKDGKEVYSRSYGFADVEKKAMADANTKYRVGSISKTFTATIVMKLVEEQKLQLSAKLSDYYPQIKNADQITLDELLQHRSGIQNFTSYPDYGEWNTKKQSKDQLLTRIASGESTFAPGSKMDYSNSNYVLLSFIAEDVTGKSFSSLLQEFITVPCGLKNTYVGGVIGAKKNEAHSYSMLSDWSKQSETDPSIPLGAGSLVSTPHDLNIFFSQLFAGKIISAQSLEQMTLLKDNFGFGLFLVPFYTMVGYGHTGGIDGFASNAFYFPAENVSIALTSNGVVYPLNDIIVGALSIYFGKPYELPVFPKTVKIEASELIKYLGVYSAPTFPIKLTVTQKDGLLLAQGTGQPSFPLEYQGGNKFRFEPAKVEIEFDLVNKKMMFRQGGISFELSRE